MCEVANFHHINPLLQDKCTLKLEKAKREHTGIYTLVVASEAGEDKSDITIKVRDAQLNLACHNIP